ncbi:hypothetical protein [Vulcanisaeta sp. JCM 14467]|uniref:hypothetical protein n=1 Tax=Vulcanisaeta sp. JCM 14467 TaxID=1295370 RepID=UPI0006D0FBF0|nr:hypothetical protein [Vulcanisaeta sp. JCM 14467]
MSSALGEFGELNVDSLRRNRFCRGIGGGRGKGYRCGGEAGEEEKVKAVGRIQRWRVWEAWWIEEWMGEWLERRDRLEQRLRGKYNNEIINDITGLVDRFIGYSERFLNYWRSVGGETKKLIEDLINGRTEVVIRGEDASGISVRGEFITLMVDMTRNGGITVQLNLKGLEGADIEVPNIFIKIMSEEEYRKFIRKILRALKGGFEETDGYVDKGYAVMSTTQLWQIIIWALLYFGRMYVGIDAINVNKGSITVEWFLRSSHKSLKGKILSNVEELSMEELLAFIFTAVLGDGSVVRANINIMLPGECRWETLLEKLKNMGFKSGKPYLDSSNVVGIPFYSSNAIGLARAMIGVLPPILRGIMDALSFEKWSNLRRIAEMEMKYRRSEMQVNVAGYGFTVVVHETTIELVRRRGDEVIKTLKAVYGDEFVVNVRKYFIAIPAYVIEKYDDIKEQVIKVLCRKLGKTKDEKKKQTIIKHLKRLTPTKGRPRRR